MAKQVFNSLFVSVLLAGPCHAKTLAAPTAFVPKKGDILKSTSKTAVLGVRGGAGHLDPMTMAKVSNMVCLAQAVVTKEAPSFTCELYGVESNAMNDLLMKSIGIGTLSFMLLSYCLLFQNASYTTAFRIGLIPWILEFVGRVFSKDFSTIGFKQSGNVFNLVSTVFMSYAATQDWSDTALKVFIAFWAIQGIYLAVDPIAGTKVWADQELSGSSVILMRLFGFYLLASALFQGAVVFYGKDAVTALGCGLVGYLAFHLTTLFVTGEVDKFGIDKNSQIFWALFHAVVVGTILI